MADMVSLVFLLFDIYRLMHGSHDSEEEIPTFPFFGTASDKRGKTVNSKSEHENTKTTGRENKV